MPYPPTPFEVYLQLYNSTTLQLLLLCSVMRLLIRQINQFILPNKQLKRTSSSLEAKCNLRQSAHLYTSPGNSIPTYSHSPRYTAAFGRLLPPGQHSPRSIDIQNEYSVYRVLHVTIYIFLPRRSRLFQHPLSFIHRYSNRDIHLLSLDSSCKLSAQPVKNTVE